MNKKVNRKCKTISFDLNDKHEIELMEYAEQQGKFSRYIKRLIDDDRKGRVGVNVSGEGNHTPVEEEKDKYTLEAMNGFI